MSQKVHQNLVPVRSRPTTAIRIVWKHLIEIWRLISGNEGFIQVEKFVSLSCKHLINLLSIFWDCRFYAWKIAFVGQLTLKFPTSPNKKKLLPHITYSRDGENFFIYPQNSC